MRLATTLAVAALSCAAHNGAAHAASFSYDAKSGNMSVMGLLEPGDVARFKAALKRVPNDGLKLLNLDLNSRGGDWETGGQLATEVLRMRERGWRISTIVDFSHVCSSSCISVFAVGTPGFRFVMGHTPGERDGALSVHTVVMEGDTEESPEAAQLTLQWVRALKGVGVPDSVTAKLATTTARHGTVLDAADLGAWGVQVLRRDEKGFFHFDHP